MRSGRLDTVRLGHGGCWQIGLMIKLFLVAVTGIGAAVHSRTLSPAAGGMTAGFGLLATLGALFVGILLSSGR